MRRYLRTLSDLRKNPLFLSVALSKITGEITKGLKEVHLTTVRMTLSFFQDFDIGQGKGHSDRESDP